MMMCVGFEPWSARWQAQTKPRSYDGRPVGTFFATVYLDIRFHILQVDKMIMSLTQFRFYLNAIATALMFTCRYLGSVMEKRTNRCFNVLCRVSKYPTLVPLFTRRWSTAYVSVTWVILQIIYNLSVVERANLILWLNTMGKTKKLLPTLSNSHTLYFKDFCLRYLNLRFLLQLYSSFVMLVICSMGT